MKFLARVRSWTRTLFGREGAERDMDAELRSHMEMHAKDLMRSGMPRDEALREARVAFGGVENVKEECRDAIGISFLESFMQDLRFGLRMLRKSPGFTAVCVVTLALGIGANTAIFSLIDGLLLRSIPVGNPQQLVLLKWSGHKTPKFHGMMSYGDCESRFGGKDPSSCSFSHPFFDDLRTQRGMFSGVAASGGTMAMNLTGSGPARIVRALIVSGNYFDVLQVQPAAGRMINASDDSASAAPAAVISYGYWQRAFAGSPSAIGKAITLNGVPMTIVGVAEPRFAGLTPGRGPDAWVPISLRPRLDPHWNPGWEDAGDAWLFLVARLRRDVPRAEAQAAASVRFSNAMLHGETPLATEADDLAVTLVPAQTGLTGVRMNYSTPLFVLMVAVGIVLLIASANVAGLLLARSTARRKEMAVRLALGARRRRIARQLLAESMLLSVLGAILGIFLANGAGRAIAAFVANGSTQPLGFEPTIDYRVLLFTLAITLLVGVLFGLAPAWRSARVDLTPALKDGAGFAGHMRHHWWNTGNLLVVAQVALTMVVMVGAGLVVRTLRNLRAVDPGFVTENVLNFHVNPQLAGYKGAAIDNLLGSLRSRLAAIPGVKSVSYSNLALLSGSWSGTHFHLDGAPEKSSVSSGLIWIGPDFFSTMKIPILEGRDFSVADFTEASIASASSSLEVPSSSNAAPAGALSPQAAVVNQAFVRKYFSNVNPLGQHLGSTGGDLKRKDPGYVVVGVVGDTKYISLRKATDPTAYAPLAGQGVDFELQTAVNPNSAISAVRAAVNQADNNLPISDVATESQIVDRLLFQERLMAQFSSFFGVLALVLACIGLYGLLSYDITRRTREIGIRMALGAGQREVLRNVVGQGLALAFVGLIVGILSSFAVTRFLGSLLFDVHSDDPATLLFVAAILVAVASIACYIPARRATRIDPLIALREE